MKSNILSSIYKASVFVSMSFISIHASAQYSKLTLDATIGTNYTFCAVQSLPGIGSTVSLHYTPSRLISFSSDISAGVLWGRGVATVSRYSGVENNPNAIPQSYSFSTKFYSCSGRGYVNIYKLLNSGKAPRKIIPYLYSGIGFIRAESKSEGLNNNFKSMLHQTYFTGFVGLQIRIKGSRKLDYLLCMQQNITETIFLDALPFEKQADSFMSVSAGVSYSLCNDRRSNFIDWSKRVVCRQAMY